MTRSEIFFADVALAGMYIHGLLGMNFLSNFYYEVRSGEQRILVEKIAT